MKLASLPIITFIAILGTTASLQADFWGPIKQTEFYSPERTCLLKIEPDSVWSHRPGHCQATLYQMDEKQTAVWSRCLINDRAPVRVFVADSGNYVVTMDEWRRVGNLPVVIYGSRGELIRVHCIESLGLKDDILHITQSVSSYWWNDGSVSFFGPEEEYFFIRLHWGKWIVLDLRLGRLFEKEQVFFRDDLRLEHERKWAELEAYRQETLAARVLEMLESEDKEERVTGANICRQEQFTQAIPRLEALLDDARVYVRCYTGDQAEGECRRVRDAAREALEAMGQSVPDLTDLDPADD